MILCKKCNASIDDDAKFCTYCGAEVKQEEVSVENIPSNTVTTVLEEKKIIVLLKKIGIFLLAAILVLLLKVVLVGLNYLIDDQIKLTRGAFLFVGVWLIIYGKLLKHHSANALGGLLIFFYILGSTFLSIQSSPDPMMRIFFDNYKINAKEKISEKVTPDVDQKQVEEISALAQMQKQYIEEYDTTLISYEYNKQKCKIFDIKILLRNSNYILEDIYIGYTINDKQWWFKNTPLAFPQNVYVGCESIEDVSQIKEIKTKKNADLTKKSVVQNDKIIETSTPKDYFENGKIFYQQENYAKAIEFFEKSCAERYALGCMALGLIYEEGKGAAINISASKNLYKKACDFGSGDGCFLLGSLYNKDDSIEYNPTKARALFEQACDQGSLDGCAHLGAMYELGAGIKQNKTKAIELFEKVCDGDRFDGCVVLGHLYQEDKNSMGKAKQAYEKACTGGISSGCNNLGIWYIKGDNVPQDNEKALEYFNKACNMKDENGCKNYIKVKNKIK